MGAGIGVNRNKGAWKKCIVYCIGTALTIFQKGYYT